MDWAKKITLSPGHHDSALGLALFALDDPRARARLNSALEHLSSGRTRTTLRCQIRLAILDIRDGAREEGEARARQVAARAMDIQSTRITSDMGLLIQSMQHEGMSDLATELTATLRA